MKFTYPEIFRFILAGVAATLIPFGAEAARKKRQPAPNPAELLEQATEAFSNYNPALAAETIAKLRKVKNLPDPLAVDSLEEKVDRMESMMQRVDAIEVIDSLTVSREDFFTHYRMNPAAGYLLTADELGSDFDAAEPTSVYVSENGAVMLWGTDSGLVESHRLTDGSWEEPSPLGDLLNVGAVANFPFLMSDGITLYYATEGDDSLGGYDIYVSRRNGEEFPAPQNMGMPYNSPYDDFLLAIDEETGAGWWATDRNSPGGDVTIYVFVPAETRINVDVDDPLLAARARLSSIALTRSDTDRSALLAAIDAIEPGAGIPDNTPDFEFVFPDGRVFTRWDDFTSPQARRLMENYVDALAERDADVDALSALRLRYMRGDKAVGPRILQLEKKLLTSAEKLKSMSNRIILAESK
ncbi:MAG: hypothetical protein K2O38_02055 [Muribaculaceae bacterium]|nr:hypothetical protein [Muribaculaceae bacterium]